MPELPQSYFTLRPGDLAITYVDPQYKDWYKENNKLYNTWPHIVLVVGWVPRNPELFDGYNLYSLYDNIPASEQSNYTIYVVDRGLAIPWDHPQTTYKARGPRTYWCRGCGNAGYLASGYEFWRRR